MSIFHSSTKYDVNPKTLVCTNPDCEGCPPGYGDFKSKYPKRRGKCYLCGEPLTVIDSEPLTK